MRRVAKLSAACIASAALALTATACGSTSSDNNSSSASSSGGGDGVKIGLAFDVGGRGDRSFNDSAARGADKAKEEFGGEIKELTAKTSDTEADREQRLNDLAQAGYNPVIGVGYAYAASMTKVAAKYPKTSFGIVDSVVDAKNVNSITFTEEQGSYLAGVAAALKSKSGHIGFIGGVDVPLIKKFEAGYIQGAKDTKPGIKIETQYLSHGSDTSGFASPDKGKAAAKGMLDKGADVIYSAAGSSGNGSIEAVSGVKGAWAIGVDSDQYNIPSLAKYKDSILTSMVKNVDVGVYDFIKSVHDGKPLTGVNSYSLAKNGVSLSTSGGFIDDIQPQLDAAKKKIVDGQIQVKTTP
ncbi:BMP family ABC transporter substrate-binding protein [Streptomyces actuosus]|uniref:BMP family ABC transporter substrate-binding protein n=1 Tax=Streptomyces actuosus TaxID=1885 RepID=A0ABS2VMR9_STRAS|nr:BMP family ABC transporter substrate-binding protein [Streptomyces actuosus]MBN0044393.1 BMP family ABC transporter substrate-binding protein [Streptomyces actuosus]